MINHTRTLLLNQLAVSCTGLEYNEYIDPNFIPVGLTPQLQQVYTVIYSTLGMADRLKILTGLLSILHINLLEPYTLYFDSRITYNKRALDLMSNDITIVSVNTLNNQLDQRLLDYNVLNAVFKPTARGNIQEIYGIWSQSHEVSLKLGAALLAYTYQLENIRKT